MKMTAGVVYVLVLLCASDAARAEEYYTAFDLLQDCEGRDEQYCYGYLEGFRTAWYYAESASGTKKCLLINSPLPDGITHGQLALVFIKWAKDHPQRLHHSPESVVLHALKAAWPCPRGSE